MTDTTGLELGGDAALDPSVLQGDGVPDENQSLTCFSCDEPMTDLYCGNCGQKNDDFRRPLWKLGAEAFAAFTAIENRIWRTWGNLLARPGRVPREYADGRRFHWSSPVRVYIFMSILLFGFMEVTGTYFFALELDLKTNDGVEKDAADLTVDDVSLDWDTHMFPTAAQVADWNADMNFRLLREKVLAGGLSINTDLPELEDLDVSETRMDPGSLGILIGQVEAVSAELSVEERTELITELRELVETTRAETSSQGTLAVVSEIERLAERQQAVLDAQLAESPAPSDSDPSATPSPVGDTSSDIQGETGEESQDNTALDLNIGSTPVKPSAANQLLLDFVRNPAIGNNILNRWLPRIIFLMMPLSMLISALFIRGRGKRRKRGPHKGEYRGHEALLYDHIVHAAYIHAVAYLLLFIGILAARLIPGGTLAGLIFLLLLIYLPLSLHRMFGRGWIKTVWTAYAVAFIYLIIVFSLTIWAVSVGIQDEILAREALL